jgi:hypothetical protein
MYMRVLSRVISGEQRALSPGEPGMLELSRYRARRKQRMSQIVLSCKERLCLLGTDTRHVAPSRETGGEDGAVVAAGKAMPLGTEVFSDGSE